MNAQQLKNAILQEAIQGRLLPQDPNDEPASVLLDRIRKEKAKLVKEGKLKKKDLEEKPISEEEIPFEIPASWKWVRFGAITINRDSERVPLSVEERSKLEKKYDYYGASGVIDKVDKYLFNKPLLLIGEDGANLINRSTPIAFIARGEYWVNNHAHVLDYYCEDLMQYICLYINAISLVDYITGTAQPKMNQEKMNSIPIPLPPLAEQHRIVSKIEELLPKVEEYGKAQDALDKLNKELPERLKKSILQEAIQGRLVPQDPNDEPASVLLDRIRKEKAKLVKEGKLKKKDLEEKPISEEEIPFEIPESWEWVRLSQISLDSADGPFGSNLKKDHYTNSKEVRIIQLSNIGELGWRDDNKKYTTYKHLETIRRSEAFAGDIIIAKMMPAGRAIICPAFDNKYVLSSDAVRFDFSNYLYKNYLYYSINSSIFRSQVYANVQGITRVRTSLSKLRDYLIPLPPLAEQQRIVAKIEELFQEIDKLK